MSHYIGVNDGGMRSAILQTIQDQDTISLL
jgi:hypothetical protein